MNNPMLCASLLLTSLAKQTPDLPTIVAGVRAAYTTCNTYRDSGSSVMVFSNEKGVMEQVSLTFKTIFKRPGKLRFEFVKKDAKGRLITSVLLAPGERVKARMNEVDGSYIYEGWIARTDNGPLRPASQAHPLSLAIARFTGISHGTAHTVPNWIFPKDIEMLDLLAVKDLALVGSGEAGKRDCYVLEVKSYKTKLWFDKKSFLLIQQVEESAQDNNVKVLQTVLYEPAANGPINDDEFVFPWWVTDGT